MSNKSKLIILLLSMMTVAAQSATPVSKEYVDEKIAILQAEINQLMNGG